MILRANDQFLFVNIGLQFGRREIGNCFRGSEVQIRQVIFTVIFNNLTQEELKNHCAAK